MIEVKGTIVGNQGTIQSSEVNTKETVVGKLGNTKQSLNGSPNVAGVFVADYKLPIATEETLGGIIVGDNLTVEEDGRLNAVVPTKASELENDSGYITKIPNDYVTEEELANKGYLTKVPSAYKTKEENDKLYQPIGDYALNENIPTKVGDLENDIGYITEVPSEYITEEELATSLSTKADKTDIPTKTSQLTNDSGFLTKIPSEYVTESELDSKGYLTEHQDISHLATKSELHTHSNKTILDSITQDNVDKWNAGSRNVVLSATEPTMGEEIWFQKSVNLFNKATVNTSNALLLNSTGGEQYSSDYRLSEYIEIKPNTQYTISGVHLFFQQDSDIASYCFYDGNKTFISAIGVQEGTDTFTTPSGAYFIRCSIYYYSKKSNNLDTFQLEIGSTASAYQPYVSEKIYTKTNGGYEEFSVEANGGGSTGGVVEESDPTVPAHVKAITQADIAKWNSGTGGGTGGGIPAVILYESENDVSCDVTLSESLANFKYVEIFYSYLGNTWGYDYTKVYEPDGKLINLSVDVLNNNRMYTTTSTWSLSGTTITKAKAERFRFGVTPDITRAENAEDIVINKVIGYYDESSGGSVKDTGWIDAELTDDFELYNSSSYCRYAKIGNMVNIQFSLKPTSSSNTLNSASLTTAFTLPEEYIPSQSITVLCQGSGTNVFIVDVTTEGKVNLARYRNSASYSSSPPSTTAWLPCNITYFVDSGELIVGSGGTATTNIYSGTTEPDATLGKDGDIYIKYS